MSTFKRPPPYATVLLDFLDAARKESSDEFCMHSVVKSVMWKFPGGRFGDMSAVAANGTGVVNETSMTELPAGTTQDMANAMLAVSRAEGVPLRHLRLPECMMQALSRRASSRQFRKQARDVRAQKALFTLATDGERVVSTGMSAVYAVARHLAADVWDADVVPQAALAEETRLELMEALVYPSTISAGLYQPDLREHVGDVRKAMREKRVSSLVWVVKSLVLLERAMLAPDVRIATRNLALDVESSGRAALDNVRMPSAWAGTVRFILAAKTAVWRVGKVSYTLSLADVRKLVQLMTGIRNAVAAACSDAVAGTAEARAGAVQGATALVANIRDVLTASASCPLGDEIQLAKVMKDVVSVYKAGLAGPACAADRAELLAALRATPAYAWASDAVEAVISRTAQLQAIPALNAVKVFRLLPPPDVMAASALLGRWKKACVIRHMDPAILAEYRAALITTVLTARIRKPGPKLPRKPNVPVPPWWGDYLSEKWELLPTGDLGRVLAWEGTGLLPVRARSDPAVWKDSNIGADTLEEAAKGNRRREKVSMILRMLYDADCPMPDAAVAYAEEISCALLKPESHKERITYSNHLASRFRQSRLEEAVGEVMKYHPSFAIKKLGYERAERFDAFSTPTRVAGMVTLYYSFDVTGWSENMAEDFQTISHEVWDMYFGTTEFTACFANMRRARVYVDADGFFAWYVNGVANFEGYNGKELTAAHIAVMVVAVDRLRVRFPEIAANTLFVSLMAYIDDGVARIDLPAARALEVFTEFKRLVTTTWAQACLTIEEKKSFPSDRFFEFLNEAYYAGRHLAHGVKAAMRITADPFEAHESLPERVKKLCSGARGAAVAGLNPIAVILLQSFFVAMEVSEWVRVRDPAATAFWAYTPWAYGGLGLPGLLQQEMNASGASTEEGAEFLRQHARVNDAAAAAYQEVMLQPWSERSASAVLSSPMAGCVSGSAPKTSFIASAVRDGLQAAEASGQLSPLASQLMRAGHMPSYESFADSVVPLGEYAVVQEQLLNDLHDGTSMPVRVSFMSRFEKAATLQRVAGGAALRMAPRLAREDVCAKYDKFMRLVRAR